MTYRYRDGKAEFWCTIDEVHRLPDNGVRPDAVAHVTDEFGNIVDYIMDSTGTWVPKEGK